MLLLGILPTAAAVLTGSFGLLAVGLLMILAAGGDFTLVLRVLLRRDRARETLFLDHPSEIGLVLFERD